MIQSWTEDPEFHDHIELSLRDDSIGGVMLHQKPVAAMYVGFE